MSSIFQPFRSLGLITSNVPLHVQKYNKSTSHELIVPAGDRFNIYSAGNLSLKYISDSIGRNIECITGNSRAVFVSAGENVFFFKHRRLTNSFKAHSDNICAILLVSDKLITYDVGGIMKIWIVKGYSLLKELSFDVNKFAITKIFHPRDYKNKVLLGSSQGELELWNINTFEKLYWFKGFGSAVTSISESVLSNDIVCIGLNNSQIIFHNILYDKTVLKVCQPGGCVTGVVFRGIYDFEGNFEIERLNRIKDSSKMNPIYFISSSENGHTYDWILGIDDKQVKCRTVGETANLHHGKILSMNVLPTKSPETGNAVECLVTQGTDNCLKISIYEREDSTSRVVYKRDGHFMPPTKISFWPNSCSSGSLIISCGKDKQAKIFSTLNERFDKSIGFMYTDSLNSASKDKFKDLESLKNAKASSKKQRLLHENRNLLPEVIDLSISDTRAEQWDNLVFIHENKRQITTWDFVKGTKGRHGLIDGSKFYDKTGFAAKIYKDTVATSVYMSKCGNFFLVGYSSGDVIKFNIQAGQDRGSFGVPTAHKSPIVHACCTLNNKTVISVSGIPSSFTDVDSTLCHQLGEISFWDFHTHKRLSTIRFNDSQNIPSKVFFNAEVDLMAIALTSGEIVLLDVHHRRIIRKLERFKEQPIIDMIMTPEGNWLLVAHRGQHIIRTWDIINGYLIDAFKVSQPITSFALSPNAEFLATTHTNSLGIYLWKNRSLHENLRLTPKSVEDINFLTNDLPSNSMQIQKKIRITKNVDLDQVESFSDALSSNTDENLSGSETEEIIVTITKKRRQDRMTKRSKKIDSSTYLNPIDYGGVQQIGTSPTFSSLSLTFLNCLQNLKFVTQRNLLPSDVIKQEGGNLPFFLPFKETINSIQLESQTFYNTSDMEVNIVPKLTTDKAIEIDAKKEFNILACLDGFKDGITLLNLAYSHSGEITYDNFSNWIMSQPANSIDTFIQSLVQEDASTYQQDTSDPVRNRIMFEKATETLIEFLSYISNRFEVNRDIDFATICLTLILKYHINLLMNEKDRTVISEWSKESMDVDFVEGEIRQPVMSKILLMVKRCHENKTKSIDSMKEYLRQCTCLIDFVHNPISQLR